MTPVGFPHSDIRGSQPACGSPRLIAACHVLHRLPAPRHPPRALPRLASPPFLTPFPDHPARTGAAARHPAQPSDPGREERKAELALSHLASQGALRFVHSDARTLPSRRAPRVPLQPSLSNSLAPTGPWAISRQPERSDGSDGRLLSVDFRRC